MACTTRYFTASPKDNVKLASLCNWCKYNDRAFQIETFRSKLDKHQKNSIESEGTCSHCWLTSAVKVERHASCPMKSCHVVILTIWVDLGDVKHPQRGKRIALTGRCQTNLRSYRKDDKGPYALIEEELQKEEQERDRTLFLSDPMTECAHTLRTG